MTKFLITVVVALVGLLSKAQVSEARNISCFNAIDVQHGITVIYTAEGSPSVTVEADTKNNADAIITKRRGNTLKIYMDEKGTDGNYQNLKYATVYITSQDVTSFTASSGAAIKTNAKISAENITVNLASGGTFNGAIMATNKCTVNAKSGGSFTGNIITNTFAGYFKNGAAINITGYAKNTTIISTTGATCMAKKFTTEAASIDAKNTSSVVITVKKSVSAIADNSASITYYGGPADININKNSYAIKRN